MGGQGAGAQSAEKRVWVLDTRATILERIETVMGGDDWQVECFSDARRALLHARHEVPDVIILGLGENTIEPADLLAIRNDVEAVAGVPLIALYGQGDVISVDEVMAQGVADAVAVDNLEDELVRRVQWQLQSCEPIAPKASRLASIDGLSAMRTFDFLVRVIEASPNAIVVARRTGEMVLFNPAAEEILGWSKDEVLGTTVRRLYPPGGAERIMQMIRADAHGGTGMIESLREVVVDSEGELIPVEISAALVCEDDREIATVGIFSDLRQQMRMEERLHEAMEALENTQRQAVVAEVAGAAAHELNQPLTSMLGYVDYLRRQFAEGDELHRVVSTIYDDTSRIAEVVRKIGRVTRYRTRDYAGGEQIVDLDEASSVEEVDEIPEVDEINDQKRTAEIDRITPGEQREGE